MLPLVLPMDSYSLCTRHGKGVFFQCSSEHLWVASDHQCA
jgi:hypothetical protein